MIKENMKFNNLIVIKQCGINKRKEKLWECLCSCGKKTIVKTFNLTANKISSCGCKKRGKKRDDSIIGKNINNFKIIEFSGKNKWRELIYKCKCLRCNKISNIKRSRIKYLKSCSFCKWKDYKDITQGYWNSLKRGAKARDLSFNISMKYAWNLFLKQNKKCALSGIDIILCRKWTKKQTASLDRIDNSIGYENGNIQWVHKDLNMLRQGMDINKFILLCKKVSKNEQINC